MAKPTRPAMLIFALLIALLIGAFVSWRLYGVDGVAGVLMIVIAMLLVAIDRNARRHAVLEHSLREGAQRASLTAVVAVSMSSDEPIQQLLDHACQAIIEYTEVDFAGIWTTTSDDVALELQASAGQDLQLYDNHTRIPIGTREVGLIAAEKRAYLTNDVQNDQRVADQDWARREGLVGFVGYPLVVDNRVAGVLGMFSRAPLAQDSIDALVAMVAVLATGIERKRADAELRESEARYRFLADALPDQVWTADASGVLEYVNARATTYFGRSFDELVGASWDKVAHTEDAAVCLERWNQSVASGEPYELELRLRAADDTYRTHMARALPYRGRGGQIVKWVGTNTDFSERKLHEDERERLFQALARSNQELDQFAYVASHDLKAPLRGIANLSQWIEEDLGDRMTDVSREQTKLLRGRVSRLEALIDGILNYSRAGRGNDAVDTVDVARLLREVVDMTVPATPSATVTVGAGMPMLRTAKVQLQQVFLNLVGNAIKHSRRDDARVEIGVRIAGDYFDFSVTDNGPGIAPEFQARIWEIFQTLDARDRVEGTGIGLSVVRKIVETRGGKAWVESRLDAGAAFHFLWPAHELEKVTVRAKQ